MSIMGYTETLHAHTAATITAQYLAWIHSRTATVEPSYHVLVFLDLLASEHFASLSPSIPWSQQHQHSVLH